jgi:hypothetical protein
MASLRIEVQKAEVARVSTAGGLKEDVCAVLRVGPSVSSTLTCQCLRKQEVSFPFGIRRSIVPDIEGASRYRGAGLGRDGMVALTFLCVCQPSCVCRVLARMVAIRHLMPGLSQAQTTRIVVVWGLGRVGNFIQRYCMAYIKDPRTLSLRSTGFSYTSI